jgi:hypothetical protein
VSSKPSEIFTFMSHIHAGAALSCFDKSLLMFSGGKTTDSDKSEALSYYQVTEMLYPTPTPWNFAMGCCELEENATDSYQNLLFSILEFHRGLGRYPEQVTVITHGFKERRFLELHAPAIKWPASRIRVQGINPPFSKVELEETQRLEHARAYELFVQDPYGAHSPLSDKRRNRHWRQETADKLTTDLVVRRLLGWTGGTTQKELFPHRLPWQED